MELLRAPPSAKPGSVLVEGPAARRSHETMRVRQSLRSSPRAPGSGRARAAGPARAADGPSRRDERLGRGAGHREVEAELGLVPAWALGMPQSPICRVGGKNVRPSDQAVGRFNAEGEARQSPRRADGGGSDRRAAAIGAHLGALGIRHMVVSGRYRRYARWQMVFRSTAGAASTSIAEHRIRGPKRTFVRTLVAVRWQPPTFPRQRPASVAFAVGGASHGASRSASAVRATERSAVRIPKRAPMR